MLNSLARGIAVVTEAGANAGDFIGGNRSADTAATNEHAAHGFAVENDFRQCFGIVWIIDRRVTVCADVDDGVPCLLQVLADDLLHLKPGVIGANRHAHGYFPITVRARSTT